MNAADIKAYVRYIADWRLTQLKLPSVFGYFDETESGYRPLGAHPLPWLVEILNGVEHANFFEQRAIFERREPRKLGRAGRRVGRVRGPGKRPASRRMTQASCPVSG